MLMDLQYAAYHQILDSLKILITINLDGYHEKYSMHVLAVCDIYIMCLIHTELTIISIIHEYKKMCRKCDGFLQKAVTGKIS